MSSVSPALQVDYLPARPSRKQHPHIKNSLTVFYKSIGLLKSASGIKVTPGVEEGIDVFILSYYGLIM